ncbi:hypothetical protein V6N13_053706 [Hibiscus sabdariffa]
MTNVEQTRRHFTTDERCPTCNVQARDVNHVLRLCPVARLTWTVLIRPECMHAFLSCPFRNCLSLNLSKDGGFARNTSYWDLLFPVVLWNLWHQGNALVFGCTTKVWGSVLARSRWLVDTSHSAVPAPRLGPSMGPFPPPESYLWSPTPMGWVKLNFDGSHSLIDGNTACGGVLRDYHGSWVRGFSKFVGRCSTLEEELWGMATGLKIAWDMG